MQEVGGVMDSGAGTGHSEGAGTGTNGAAALHGAAEPAGNASGGAPLTCELGIDLGASTESGNEALLGPVCSDIALSTGAAADAAEHGSDSMVALESWTCGRLLLSATTLVSAEAAGFSCTVHGKFLPAAAPLAELCIANPLAASSATPLISAAFLAAIRRCLLC